ncbi:MAG: peroxidase family protein [Phycisphaerales bacterium JB054]
MKRAQITVLLAGLAVATVTPGAFAQDAQDVKPDERSPVQRNRRVAPGGGQNEGRQGERGGEAAVFPFDIRSIDGSGNNLAHSLWGAAGGEFIRIVPSDYGDGVSTPAGADRPSARFVSNTVHAQDGAYIPNLHGYSDFMWQWGQFVDHDITETPLASPSEAFDIAVPTGDVWFDPFGTGDATIPLDRSAWSLVDGVREQVNNLTAYIDATNVYGAEEERTHELRTLDGTGRMKTSAGDLLPFNVNGFDNAPSSADPSFFLGGDIRANEQVGLTAMHTVFVREHNRLADEIALEHPELSGDEIFEYARAIVAAEMQAITYREFLPRLLGRNALPAYRGYRPEVNAGIANEFATAAYRVGHTMLSTELLRLDANGNEIAAGNLDLASSFFNPSVVIEDGIEPLLRGLASQSAQKVDAYVVDDLRNFLFGPPGSGGFDLVSLNIQRGRDHGLPSYNDVRYVYGLPRVQSFAEFNTDPEVRDRLAAAYASPDDVDAWVGLLAESNYRDAFVGETLFRVLRDQFLRLRDGDRFWYQAYLPDELVREVEASTLAEIIRRNTDIGLELQDDVFVRASICAADIAAPIGTLSSVDVLEFLNRFSAREAAADFTGDGQVNSADVVAYLNAFASGCGQ